MHRVFGTMALVLLGVGITGVFIPTVAQTPGDIGIGLTLGPIDFDWYGDGSGYFVGLKGEYGLSRHLLLEGGLGYHKAVEWIDVNDIRAMPSLVPEVQLQLQAPLKVVRPYAGIGFGALIDLRDRDDFVSPNRRRAFFCYTAALGTRIALTNAVALRLELRGRAIDLDWFGNTASESLEYTGGIQWTFNAPERSAP